MVNPTYIMLVAWIRNTLNAAKILAIAEIEHSGSCWHVLKHLKHEKTFDTNIGIIKRHICGGKWEFLKYSQWHHKEPEGEKEKHLDFQVLLPLIRSPHPAVHVSFLNRLSFQLYHIDLWFPFFIHIEIWRQENTSPLCSVSRFATGFFSRPPSIGKYQVIKKSGTQRYKVQLTGPPVDDVHQHAEALPKHHDVGLGSYATVFFRLFYL